ncbi:hypothetical protein [Brevibacterium celere]|uniref:hypothetical protein n=1 Tax=Brevibacterium celere TaxID=225845 RepID=UPI001FE66567|nr:hypothetical protein [Brevibacterium celere]
MDIHDIRTDRADDPGDLVSQHRRRREPNLILHHVQVGVADTACRHLYEHFLLAGFAEDEKLLPERFIGPFEDECAREPVVVGSGLILCLHHVSWMVGCTVAVDGAGLYAQLFGGVVSDGASFGSA